MDIEAVSADGGERRGPRVKGDRFFSDLPPFHFFHGGRAINPADEALNPCGACFLVSMA
jgi:hypothetical protein